MKFLIFLPLTIFFTPMAFSGGGKGATIAPNPEVMMSTHAVGALFVIATKDGIKGEIKGNGEPILDFLDEKLTEEQKRELVIKRCKDYANSYYLLKYQSESDFPALKRALRLGITLSACKQVIFVGDYADAKAAARVIQEAMPGVVELAKAMNAKAKAFAVRACEENADHSPSGDKLVEIGNEEEDYVNNPNKFKLIEAATVDSQNELGALIEFQGPPDGPKGARGMIYPNYIPSHLISKRYNCVKGQ